MGVYKFSCLQGGRVDDEPLLHDVPLTCRLWNDKGTQALKVKALATEFIGGIGKGTLHPDIYGRYTVQDAVYCAKIAVLWQQLSNNPTADAYLQSVARQLSAKYAKVATEMLNRWQIRAEDSNQYGVWLGEHATDYVQVVEESVVKKHPAYMLVAAYPCLKLWPFLASILSPLQPANNMYAFWIKQNEKEGSSVQLLEKAINHYATHLDYNEALQLFHKGLECEINFFNKP